MSYKCGIWNQMQPMYCSITKLPVYYSITYLFSKEQRLRCITFSYHIYLYAKGVAFQIECYLYCSIPKLPVYHGITNIFAKSKAGFIAYCIFYHIDLFQIKSVYCSVVLQPTRVPYAVLHTFLQSAAFQAEAKCLTFQIS